MLWFYDQEYDYSVFPQVSITVQKLSVSNTSFSSSGVSVSWCRCIGGGLKTQPWLTGSKDGTFFVRTGSRALALSYSESLHNLPSRNLSGHFFSFISLKYIF